MAAAARPRSSAAATRTPRATLPQRTAYRPSPARRPGGPVRPEARPAPRRVPRRARRGRGTWLGDRLRALRLAPLLDRLLRGRGWVALIAVLLTGIVFLNVALLEVNGSIARMDARAAQLKRDNAALRMRVARLDSSERIQRAAAGRGFVSAPAGGVGYVTARPGDAAAAARALESWPPDVSPTETATP